MKNDDLIKDWLKRASSNLARARAGKIAEDVLYEDICFDAHQAVEKALKALLVKMNVPFPKTHSLDVLFQLLIKSGVKIPPEISPAVILTRYAVRTRYPGYYDDLTEEEYQKALKLAEVVFDWVNQKMEE